MENTEFELAKTILDTYATEVVSKDAIYVSNGKAGVDSNKSFFYKPEKYSENICLWKAPLDWIRIEFDGVNDSQSKTLISETVSNVKALGLSYCVTYHKGAVSPYINICNLKGMPLNYDNKNAKTILLDTILSEKAKKYLDRTNLGFTWTPVIGHPHWKPKYEGALHSIVNGTNPLEQKNVYPKELLKLLKKSKDNWEKDVSLIKSKSRWVEDFLLDYCCNNELPSGKRHMVISKNLACLIIGRPDKDEIKEKYLKAQRSDSDTFYSWEATILRGEITEVNAGELKKYIDEHKIPYQIKYNDYTIKKEKELEKVITSFFDKRDLAEKFIQIQPLFYDEGRNFWIWLKDKNCWERKDEIDIYNYLNIYTNVDTINSTQRIEILEALKQVGRLRTPEKLDKHCIQFKDNILNINTGELYPASPQFFTTNPIPWDMGESAETPVIDELFCQWVGKDFVLTLKQIASYCMLIDYPIHRIFCFLGSGSNGKSKYLGFIEKLIGENNVSASELDSLMISRFEMFNLYRKLAVQMGETNFSTISRTAILKKLSGQDKISFEAKNKDPISEKNYAKLLVSTNNLPETEDKSNGFYRRWICIDFPNTFEDGKDVLDSIPEQEYRNFCKASTQILRDLLNSGKFHNEGTLQEKQERYEERSNPFDKFLEENCAEYADEYIFKYDFKNKFSDWCSKQRFRKLSDMEIASKMKANHIQEGKELSETYDVERKEYKRYRAWRGIGWKKEQTTPIETIKESIKEILNTRKKINFQDINDKFSKDFARVSVILEEMAFRGEILRINENCYEVVHNGTN